MPFTSVVLSLFPGIGMLDAAFEAEGFCVVRGPDLLWGGDVSKFHPPMGRFNGVIGGPPCQSFSKIGNVNRARWGNDCIMPDQIPEFIRCIKEAQPDWFLMENVPEAPVPTVDGYVVKTEVIRDVWVGGETNRLRRFTFGVAARIVGCLAQVNGWRPETLALHTVDAERTVSWKGAVDWKGSRAREGYRSLADMLELQGFPRDFLDHCPFTVDAAKKAVGNGVPLAMGRAVAAAVRRATTMEV